MDFIIVGLPRSGTTWAANWLTTDYSHCYHDPLYEHHYDSWDGLILPKKITGASCTGIWRWTEWLNNHPSKKVILHRDLDEINQSLREIGLGGMTPEDEAKLNEIIGMHVPFEDLFDERGAEAVWDYLMPTPFNKHRHQELKLIEMQPQFSGLSVGPDVTRRLRAELASI